MKIYAIWQDCDNLELLKIEVLHIYLKSGGH